VTTVIQYGIDAVSLGCLYAVLALGVALIYGIMRLVNFAHGELIMLGTYVLYLFSGWSPLGAMLLAMVAVVIAALIMDRVAFRPVRGADESTLLITSFAVSYLLQNLATMIFGARAKSADLGDFVLGQASIGDIRVSQLSLVTIASTALLLAGLAAFLHRTIVGLKMRAAAEDFEMSRLLGVKANSVIAGAFALSGALAAIAAILIVAQTGTVSPTVGLQPVIIAFVATIVGGLGSLFGAAIGGFGIGVLTVVLQAALPEELRPYRDALVYSGVILVLLLRPHGLVASKSRTVRV
jgi:branched-chain amino acid transport system permease protein